MDVAHHYWFVVVVHVHKVSEGFLDFYLKLSSTSLFSIMDTAANRYFLSGSEERNKQMRKTKKKKKMVEDPPRKRKAKELHQGGDSKVPAEDETPIDEAALERHSRGQGVETKRVRTKFQKKMQERYEKRRRMAEEMAARAEILQDDDEGEGGFLEGDDTDEFTAQVTQTQIRAAVDSESAAKGFDLNLKQFGPYK